MLTVDFSKVKKARLTSRVPGINSFKNIESDMETFIQNEALKDQNKKVGTTWCWVYNDEVLLGFVSLAMFSIDRKDMPSEKQGKYRYSTIPSLLIGQLAVHKEYKCNGLGKELIDFALQKASEASEVMGCRTVALHPLESAIPWYQKNTIKLIRRDKKQDIMYFDLLSNPNLSY